MSKKIFIINGSGGVGKDSFVKLFADNYGRDLVWNYSSVDKVKRIAKEIGWKGKKTEKDRKFLSDLKLLTTEYNNMPFNDLTKKIKAFENSEAQVLFLHIREPEEISKIIEYCLTFDTLSIHTILVQRKGTIQITSNMADKNVFNYIYDITIHNDGELDDLNNIAKRFVKDVKLDSWFSHAIYDSKE